MEHQELAQVLAHFGIDRFDASGTTIPVVSSAILYLQQVVGTQTVGSLDDATISASRAAIERDARPMERGWVVRGYLRDAAGNPAKGVEVVALDRDLRSESRLGVGVTDTAGRYEIAYDEAGFVRADRGYADLFVRARIGREVFESELVFNAPRVAILNLVRNPLPPLPEWLLVARTLQASLNSVAPAEVTDAEIDFLVRDTGLSREIVAAYVAAHRVAQSLQVEPVLVYACMRAGLPADQARFVVQPRGVLTAAIDTAWTRYFAPRVPDDVRERFLAVLDHWRARSLAEPGDEGTIAATLAKLVPDEQSRRQVAAFFASRDAAEDSEALWRAAAADPRTLQYVSQLRSMVELAGVFGSHPRLLDAMHDPGVLARWERQTPWTLADLAAEPRARVRELIDVAGAPDWLPKVEGLEPEELYRRAIDRVLEEVAATRRVSARLKEGSLGVEPATVTRVAAQFLDDHPDLDLRTEPVQRYVARAGGRLDEPAMRLLVGLQRLLHVTPRLDEVEALQESGFTTAARVANVPAARLRELTGLDEKRVRLIQANAQRRVLLGAVLASAAKDKGGVAAVPGTEVPPDIEGLFGSQDYCECAECRAADGPAAYLVDLLSLLRDHGGTPGKPTALAEFYTRRPDVETLQLSCYNTTTALPQIDLVNEILEGASPPTDESLSSAELRIAPQTMNHTAYAGLEAATYPWALPFELGTAHVRALLDAVGWSRAGLVDIFAATDETRALEHFAVPEAEAKLFAAPTLLGIYGTSEVAALQNVATFLERTGVSSTELFELVAIEEAISIVPEDACDFAKMTLTGATEAVLVRMGLFLRMRRRVGWSIATLHEVLDAIGSANTTDTWTALWRHARWREQWRVDAAEALAWLKGAGTPEGNEALRRVLRVDEQELSAWFEILASPADDAALDAFLRNVLRLRASKLSAPDVRWLLRADTSPPSGTMTDAQIGAALHGLRTDLANVTRSLEGESEIADLRKLAAQIYAPDQLEAVVADILAAAAAAVFPGGLLTTAELALSREQRIEAAVLAARLRVKTRDRRALVVEFLARTLGFERALAITLLTSASGAPVLEDLLTADALVGDPATDPATDAFVALRKVERLALLMKRLALSTAELTEIIEPSSSDTGWLTFSALGDGAELDALLAVVDVARVRRHLAKPFEVVTHRNAGWKSFASALVASQSWSSPEVKAFADDASKAIAADDAKFDAAYVEKLVAALALHAAFGGKVSAGQLVACAARSVQFDVSQPLEEALKSSMPAVRWAEVGREAHDRLRVERRDALVAAKLATNSASPESLFAALLIDTQVSPCVPTSRVKAAIGAVQLFIHRCIMGLEPDFVLSADVAKWWRWMQNYRVWQANRKVFLYPENWIEPELRDDKTPPFVELESALAQQEPTPTNVQTAFRGYLGALHEVGRLEIVAVFTETRSDCSDVLHVVGRRWSQPRTHFYRQRIGQTRWTPWEKLETDIEGEHVMVTVSGGRPTVIWPVIREERAPGLAADANGDPAKRWAIRFFWIEREHGKWGAKRSMDPLVATSAKSTSSDNFAFAPHVTGGTIHVAVEHMGIGVLEIGDVYLPGCGKNAATGALVDQTNTLPLSMRMIFTGHLGLAPAYERPLSGSTRLSLALDGEVAHVFFPQLTPLPAHQITPDLVDDWFPTRPFVFQNERDTFVIEPAPAPALLKSLGDRISIVGKPKWGSDAVESHVIIVGGGGSPNLPPLSIDLRKPVAESDAPRYYRVSTLEHPQACQLAEIAESRPIEALLSLATQQGEGLTKKPKTFVEFYAPDRVVEPHPVEGIDFSRSGAYASYNWELFFHAPLLIAVRLMQNGRHEDAIGYLQLIFDPTSGGSATGDGPSRYWQFLPFREVGTPTSVVDVLAVLGSASPNKAALASVLAQLDAYRNEPFNPHLIARLRIGAYMRTVVMRYLDCLIGWGDQLFRRRTLEANNQATLLYVTALQILGDRPRVAPQRGSDQLTVGGVLAAQESLDLKIEDILGVTDTDSSCTAEIPNWPVFDTVRFCVPPNDKLLAYWDTVADRLFKIRHCEDIEGNAIALPLFEPPIDPALLVRATAAGIDIGRVLDESYVPLPSYRFPIVSQKALELCNDVKALGAELLAVLEKRDAEELARLRSTQEVALLDAARSVRQGQLAEAERQLAALERQREMVETRRAHYQEVLQPRLRSESEAEKKSTRGNELSAARGSLEVIAAVANALPNFSFGTNNSIIWGMPNLGSALEATARVLGVAAQHDMAQASMLSTQAVYERRSEDWDFQGRLAAGELKQLDQHIAAAQLRVAMAERELVNHDRQRDNARAVDSQMRSKFTSRELFDWMASQASIAYSAAFQLALDMARRAERCFQFERGVPGRSYIGAAHWDDLRRGLLAGTSLHQELRQMERAYLDENRRDYEITKHISLSLLDGNQLFALRFAGECTIDLDEKLFDLDHPGHYMRRIKSVSVTIPAVVGAHASINAKLTLERSKVRKNGKAGVAPDTAFLDLPNGIESVVTSGGQNDSGMFETNLRDERYLPFEGAGAISTWKLEVKHEQNQFDPASLTDVILHVRYTAREGSEGLRQERADLVRDEPPTMTRLFSLEHDFSTAWAATAEAREAGQAFALDLDFTPFMPRRGSGSYWNVSRLAVLPRGQTISSTTPAFAIEITGFLESESTEHTGSNRDWEVGTLADDSVPRRVEFEGHKPTRRLLLKIGALPPDAPTSRAPLLGAFLVVSLS